ncbi:MAG: peptidase M50 [Candidatus Sericytochromatia bacterium]|nr:MAG: peptidase M50 [Candidatus Sericytochromatia bacterium]
MEIDIFFIIIAYLVFLISIVIHEASHAFVAKLTGDDTAYISGQLTLDPIPHIKREPLGMVFFPMLFLFLNGWPFGWASTPYNIEWAKNNHRKAALMALAGPLSNLLLAILSALILKFGIYKGIFNNNDLIASIGYLFKPHTQPFSDSYFSGIVKMLGIMFDLNMILFVLNMLPIPTFDGGYFLSIFLSKKSAIKLIEFMSEPIFALIMIIFLWNFFGYIFYPIYLLFVNMFF